MSSCTLDKEIRQRRLCKHRHGPGKDVVLCFATPNGYRDAQHPTWRKSIRKAFQWESGGGRQKPAPINVSSHLYDFCCVSDCMQALFLHECCDVKTSNSEAVE
jgi:hypothetical protein